MYLDTTLLEVHTHRDFIKQEIIFQRINPIKTFLEIGVNMLEIGLGALLMRYVFNIFQGILDMSQVLKVKIYFQNPMQDVVLLQLERDIQLDTIFNLK